MSAIINTVDARINTTAGVNGTIITVNNNLQCTCSQ